MGVDDDAFVQAEGVAEDDVRGLPADARELHELGHRARHLAAVALDEGAAEALERLRLVAEEAGGLDERLELFASGICRVVRGGRAGREERRRHHVDAHVGALRREDRRDQELERVAVVEGAMAAGVGGLETREDLGGARRARGGRLTPAPASRRRPGGSRVRRIGQGHSLSKSARRSML